MLVARTKAKQDALPRQQTVVSSARMLFRTSAGFPRAERVLASEENRRMIQTVATSVAGAHAAVKEMRVAQDRSDHTRHKLYQRNESLAYVERRLNEARKTLGLVNAEKQDVQREFKILVRARDKANTEIAQKNADMIRYELRLKKNRESVEQTEKKISELTRRLNDNALAKTRSEKQRKEIEDQIRALQGRSKKFGQKIGVALRMHEHTVSTLEEATMSFRLFERRLGRLSQETGYIIGYPRL